MQNTVEKLLPINFRLDLNRNEKNSLRTMFDHNYTLNNLFGSN